MSWLDSFSAFHTFGESSLHTPPVEIDSSPYQTEHYLKIARIYAMLDDIKTNQKQIDAVYALLDQLQRPEERPVEEPLPEQVTPEQPEEPLLDQPAEQVTPLPEQLEEPPAEQVTPEQPLDQPAPQVELDLEPLCEQPQEPLIESTEQAFNPEPHAEDSPPEPSPEPIRTLDDELTALICQPCTRAFVRTKEPSSRRKSTLTEPPSLRDLYDRRRSTDESPTRRSPELLTDESPARRLNDPPEIADDTEEVRQALANIRKTKLA